MCGVGVQERLCGEEGVENIRKAGRRKSKREQVKKVITGGETVSLQHISRKAQSEQSEQSEQRRNSVQPDFFFFFLNP